MSRNIRLAAILIAAWVVVVLVADDRAHGAQWRANERANATPGCVTTAEFDSVGYPHTKREVERAWGVVGQGVFIAADGRYREFRYLRCNHLDAAIGDDNASDIRVLFNQRTGANDLMSLY